MTERQSSGARALRAAARRGATMSGVYKKIEIVGTSKESFADATRVAITEASKTVHGMSWFEVAEMRGAIRDGKVSEFQVTLRVGFRIEH